MKCYLIAIGQSGARISEGVYYACMAGTFPAGSMTTLLLCAPGESRERMERMDGAYGAVRGGMQGGVDRCFAPDVRLYAWPRAQEGTSVQVQARTETERLLMRALFTREEAGHDLSRAMGGSGPLAALRWARLLEDEGDELAALLSGAAAEDEVILCGSLAEAAGAAGVGAMTRFLAQRRIPGRVSLAAQLAVREGDDAGLCRAALRTLRDEDYHALCLLGLPEDCRDPRHDSPDLVDWMTVRAVEAAAAGQGGRMTVRLRADGFGWEDFGSERERYEAGWDGLLMASALLAGEFGHTAAERLTSPNWLMDRLGWYGVYFGGLRRAEAEDRAAQADLLRAAAELAAGYTAWLRAVVSELPTPLHWSGEMDQAGQACREHYALILEAAGRLAQMEREAEQTGMTDEGFVHRYDMKDTPGEKLVKQIEQERAQLAALESEQEELDRQIGGRMTRSLLAEIVRECTAQADELRAQVDAAAARVEHSAQIATPEQMPRVEAARAKLERLQRHLSVLDGRTEWARRDYERAGEDDRRTQPPLLAGAGEEDGKNLYPPAQLEALEAAFAAAAARDKKQLAARLETAWRWQTPMKTMIEQIAQAGKAERAAGAGHLLRAVIACAMVQKGAESDAEAMEQRSGVTA